MQKLQQHLPLVIDGQSSLVAVLPAQGASCPLCLQETASAVHACRSKVLWDGTPHTPPEMPGLNLTQPLSDVVRCTTNEVSVIEIPQPEAAEVL